ncbi:hypothetical protein [Pseudoponticoccus marisrubri]|uniref:Uncharacterized protein n=1 Tax=Pseudoponticoccus marisrubri TaxID=1685382 RepID=A0A0W7WER9_9RHOB|nr:hypothetical protein [Pseudoponticoccus marisrubri]KUF08974.1 hypothetical protein AVJ23_20000 [Pseudoponticoccus marisrubri]
MPSLSPSETDPAARILPCLGDEIFWTPAHDATGDWAGHLPLLFWAAGHADPRVAVTLDMSDGTAHFALCQAVARLDLACQCHGILDLPADRAAPLASENAEQYERFSQLHPRSFEPDAIDLLVVAPAVNPDLLDRLAKRWLERLSERGIVLLHGLSGADAGTLDALAALCEAHAHLRLDHGNGVCLLAVGGAPAEPVATLIDLCRDEAARLRLDMILNRLGAEPAPGPASGTPRAANPLASALAGLTGRRPEPGRTGRGDPSARITALAETSAVMARQRDAARTELAGRLDEIATLKAELAEQRAQTRDAQSRLVEGGIGGDLLERMIAREKRIAELAARNDDLIEQVETLTLQLDTRFDELAAVTDTANRTDSELLKTKKALKKAQAELREAKSRGKDETRIDKTGRAEKRATLLAAREGQLATQVTALKTRLELLHQRVVEMTAFENTRGLDTGRTRRTGGRAEFTTLEALHSEFAEAELNTPYFDSDK